MIVSFVSISLRFRANVEALNMTETIGNVSRHRRVPFIIGDGSKMTLLYVPGISGESIAHAIQANLVEVSKIIYNGKPPVDPWSLRGEFVKFMDKKHLTEALKSVIDRLGPGKRQKVNVESVQHEFEKKAIEESIVADIGGFLYAENPPVKRTSPLQVGYATPVEDAIEATAIETQVHARQAVAGVLREEAGEGERERQAQMLYYVEIASAVYGLTINLDVDAIGRTSMIRVEDAVPGDERARRIKAAIAAIALTTGQGLFGAKRTRFNPIMEVINAVAVVAKPLPFTASPAQKHDYIADTMSRAKAYKAMMDKIGVEEEVKIATYKYPEYAGDKGSLEELYSWIIDEIL